MPDIVIKAENLGKKFIIGHQDDNERYTALRDVLVRNAREFWLKTRDLLQGKQIIQGDVKEEFWALKDVCFEVEQGEAIGIIGRNGAGKSTLLKVLSRIMEPSAGRVTIRGRVASLLEVGTGFHPELSGRENIYLNGAILGMTRAEVKKKFDEIVDFSGVENFLDTPVKRFSSGMYVRLAFAVAAHLDPEILVVDEVLAVGDAEFQKKCLGKMGDVAGEGRTVLFVSHNMAAIQSLCDSSMLLVNGAIKTLGSTDEVIASYMAESSNAFVDDLSTFANQREGNGLVRFQRWTVTDSVLGEGNKVGCFNPCIFNIHYQALPEAIHKHFSVTLCIKDQFEKVLLTTSTHFTNSDFKLLSINGIFKCEIPKMPLLPGTYIIHLYISINNDKVDVIRNAGNLDVIESDSFGTGRLPTKKHGYYLIEQSWSLE